MSRSWLSKNIESAAVNAVFVSKAVLDSTDSADSKRLSKHGYGWLWAPARRASA
jgi:hypothetical protein